MRHIERVVWGPSGFAAVPPPEGWPRSIPAVRHIEEEGLELPSGVTFLVGENGSGKSTIVEALAAAYPRAGHLPTRGNVTGPTPRPEDSPLAQLIDLQLARNRSPAGFFLRAELMHGYLATLHEDPAWRRQRHLRWNEQSHGESFLAIIRDRFAEVGVFFLDEPEAALSFTSTLALVALLGDMAREGSQVVVATHSPLLISLPGATILELGEWGARRVTYDDCLLVQQWRGFLQAPQRYLRHL